jgi:ornithine cyclodeaminase/alanine dehydrogenase-like protein (mu-crystallin family)
MSPQEITIFDSTGTAVEDAAAAMQVLSDARRSRVGTLSHLGFMP